MNNNSKKGAWGREEAANLQFSNLLLTTWWTRGNDIMPATDGKFFLKLKLLLLFFYWQQINMESSLYYFLRRQIGSSIIWASRRQAIMDNGNNGNIHMFSEVHIMFSSSVDTIKRKNCIWSYILVTCGTLSSLSVIDNWKKLRWCYTGRFSTTIFSATQRKNVGTIRNNVATINVAIVRRISESVVHFMIKTRDLAH